MDLPEWDPEAQKKAEERREKEDSYAKQARACLRALEERPNVREWWERRGFGQGLQQRFLLGSNKDGRRAVIPFWSRGRVQGLIRRTLQGGRKYLYPQAKAFPYGFRPLFIPGPVRSGAFIKLTRAELAAITSRTFAAVVRRPRLERQNPDSPGPNGSGVPRAGGGPASL